MNNEIRKRLKWVQLYERTQNAGLVCRNCGISRPTLRKWLKRYEAHGVDGLNSGKTFSHSAQEKRLFTIPKADSG